MKIFVANHNGTEPSYKGRPINNGSIQVDWNIDKSHHRKFIRRSGKVVDQVKGGAVSLQDLLFWGEYEPRTHCRLVKNRKSRPLAVHDVLVPVNKNGNVPLKNISGGYHNTDPYVYGDEFYYTCCKLYKNLSKYSIGDIILFGSFKKNKSQKFDFELDTVIVVSEIRDVGSFPKTSNFYKASIDPILLSGGSISKVIVGSKYHNTDTPFSFVPCSNVNDPANPDFGKKPIVDLQVFGFPEVKVPRGWISPVQATPNAWNIILNCVKNYYLGVAFDVIK